MELGSVELSVILLTAVAVLGVAFTLAWIDASKSPGSRAN